MSKEAITTVEKLVKTLDTCTEDETCYLDIMRQINIPLGEFERYFTWNDDRYTRTRLTRTDRYELLLICWEKGQHSPIHDFNAHQAWIHPITGRLKEERFIRTGNGRMEKVSSMLLGTHEFSYMGGNVQIHRYSNAYDARSVSLNLYAPPVDEWNVYNEETGKPEKQKVWVDKELDLSTAI